MGLDMNIRKMYRSTYESILHEDLWKEKVDTCISVIYWRKEYWLQTWFKENTLILEECSDELTEEKMNALFEFLRQNNKAQIIEELWTATFDIDREKYVLFYTESN